MFINELPVFYHLFLVFPGREYSVRKGLKNICPLMYCYYGTDYLGAAHGLAGILQALLAVPGIFNPKLDLERDVKRSVDYLLSLQTESGNFPCALDELSMEPFAFMKFLIYYLESHFPSNLITINIDVFYSSFFSFLLLIS